MTEFDPIDDLQFAIVILDKRRATFDPIAVIAVENAVEIADGGTMDMAANDTVELALTRLLHHRPFEAADVFDGVLDLVLEKRR